jgi:4-hydroxy-tetrahydrodipicolinate reductase
MGRAIVRLASDAAVDVVCAVAASDVGKDAGELAGIGRTGVLVTSSLEAVAESQAAVVIDFSTPAVTALVAAVAARAGIAIVSGTTGLDTAARAALAAASAHVPVLSEANMSVGVHVLADVVKAAVRALGPGYDVEIVETHHGKKVDAPSGTALLLVEAAREARGDGASLAHGRSGRPGARPATEIGVHAVRGGDVIGDHTVHLLGAGERLELTHRATSRDVFAHGALRAAAWLDGKNPGIYTMRDVLAARPSP